MNEIEKLTAEVESLRLMILALLGIQSTTNLPLLTLAVRRALECHEASSPYYTSWSDEQIAYVQQRIEAAMSGLARK